MLLPKKPPQGIWGLIKSMLKQEGALNKQYDSNLDGLIDNSDKVDGYDAGTGANQVLVLNSAGQVPLGNIPLLPDSQLDFSFGWELVGSISSSGVSSIEFSNLAGDTDKLYMLVLAAYNPSTSALGVYARFNADTTISNYNYLSWRNNAGTGSTVYQLFNSTTGKAGIHILDLAATSSGFSVVIIDAEGIDDVNLGSTVVYLRGIGYRRTEAQIECGGWKKSAEITSITLFTGTGANINWVAYLYKAKW